MYVCRPPLWRFYSQHRVALLGRLLPDRIKVVLRGACLGPPVEGLPLEDAWGGKALNELRALLSDRSLEVAPPPSDMVDDTDFEAMACETPWPPPAHHPQRFA